MSSPDQLPDRFVDQLTIETPEQTPLEFPLAGIGSRFLALALDTLIESAAFFILIFAWLGAMSKLRGSFGSASVWVTAAVVLIFFSLYFGYFAFFEAIWNGQTPGKRIIRLRVIQESGRPITVYQAIARNLLRIVDQLPGFYAIGILSAIFSRQSKRLGDHVAGTVVVCDKPFEEIQPAWETAAEASGGRFNAARLAAEEFQLIEAFLQRRSYLTSEVRTQMAHQIAERLAQKLEIPSEQRRGPALPGGDEAFLEALVRERRGFAGHR